MNTTSAEQPSVALGLWLKEKRLAAGMVARVFAQRVWLTPAKYAEVEAGVSHWIGEKQIQLISLALNLNEVEKQALQTRVENSSVGAAVTFRDLFTADELRPIRTYHRDNKQLSKDDEEVILAVVFEPLA